MLVAGSYPSFFSFVMSATVSGTSPAAWQKVHFCLLSQLRSIFMDEIEEILRPAIADVVKFRTLPEH